MSILMPDPGLLFWMLISFGVVVFVLTKYGFPVIVKMVEERKKFIDESILVAQKARTDLENVKAESEAIVANARKEQIQILNEARKSGETIIEEARFRATIEANKIMDELQLRLSTEKERAILDIRQSVANLSVDIAEKILRSKLNREKDQMDLINNLIEDINIKKS